MHGERSTKIALWNVCISGFLQTEGDPTGISEIWALMRAEIESPRSRVELRSWCQSWSDLAELVWRFRPEDRDPVVNVFGYSWGGYSATLFARELARRGLGVERMVLADAVYRHSYCLGQWRAFAPWSKITVPANVGRVDWFYQTNPRIRFGRRRSGGVFQPAGHRVVREHSGETPRIVDHAPMRCEHAYADDDRQFRELCLGVAKQSAASLAAK